MTIPIVPGGQHTQTRSTCPYCGSCVRELQRMVRTSMVAGAPAAG